MGEALDMMSMMNYLAYLAACNHAYPVLLLYKAVVRAVSPLHKLQQFQRWKRWNDITMRPLRKCFVEDFR